MVPVQRLEYLIAVAREGSFTRAAQELHVAQPALSRQVRLLEEQLGVKLLARTPQGVRPTAAGELLIERSQRLISQLDQALEDAAAVGRGERGTVTLGYTASSSHETAPRLVSWLRARLGDVDVHTIVLPRPELLAAVRDGTADLGIVRCFPPQRELVAWPFAPRAGSLHGFGSDRSPSTSVTPSYAKATPSRSPEVSKPACPTDSDGSPSSHG